MCTDHTHATPLQLGRRGLFLGAGAGTLGLGLGAAGLLQPAAAAAAVKSQNGWYAADDMVERNMINTDFSAGGNDFPAGVRRQAPNVILGFVARQFHRTVEAVGPNSYGYNFRPISGSDTYSNHASGTALDFNAPRHPQGQTGTFGPAQRQAIRKILGFCEGTVRWGGDYNGTKDEMHFEINVGPGSPELNRVVRKINNR